MLHTKFEKNLSIKVIKMSKISIVENSLQLLIVDGLIESDSILTSIREFNLTLWLANKEITLLRQRISLKYSSQPIEIAYWFHLTPWLAYKEMAYF
jgi:hypothetical protein